jgi:hypothetical protein
MNEMRKGFVARTFHIPEDIDEELRVLAIRNHVRFSDMAILSFKHYLQALLLSSEPSLKVAAEHQRLHEHKQNPQ